ncbi:hypothetical protein Rhopal_003039-T1 [Rhodotorula paludigena]|uniref:Uncharacterized protein n=1 Tax=Rhodotorula paludigena TaxID=86838 RepID=A0AAV5GKL1_9BASI|nr:hypothetical protein Rhopal_003039-T1 [Rhodotorula paludigena]
MLVARTPTSPRPSSPFFSSHDYASSGPSSAFGGASPSASSHRPPAQQQQQPQQQRPDVVRRPSALRKANSDHIITPAVLRFDPRKPQHIPSSASGEQRTQQRSVSSPTSTTTNATPGASASSSAVPRTSPPRPLAPASGSSASPDGAAPVRPALAPLVTSGTVSSSSGDLTTSSGSLLARRRSSRTTGTRADVLPMLSDLSLRGALPATGLDELDDTVTHKVIGESSHAQTPSSESGSPVVARGAHKNHKSIDGMVQDGYRPTKSFVPTPFPEKRKDWLSDEEDEEDDGKEAPQHQKAP